MKLADYLDQNGLSRAVFAARVGVSAETVRLWLNGDPQPVPQDRFLRRIVQETGGAVTALDFMSSDLVPAQEAAE
jgi:DNA-binding transcriptional regulator YiaG